MEEILRAIGISKTYGKNNAAVMALKSCDISIEKGEFVAIIGKSGSGKSTLLRILASLDKPDKGEVYIEDKNICKLSDKKVSRLRRERIGYIYQDYSLLPEYTAYENVVIPLALDGKKADKSEVSELFEQLGISHCRKKYPKQMSGGEQQRVAIARALITHPAVIFADEPTGNLDAASAQTIADMLSLASERYNQTIVMVTHDKQMADYADRILKISDGTVSSVENER